MAIIKLIKYFGALVVAALLLFVFVVNFSSVTSRFKCSGEISSEGASQPATIYIKLEKYRWWVVWGDDSNGYVWLEIPLRSSEVFKLAEVGDQLVIYDLFDKKIKGSLSTLSKTLALSTPTGFFEGTCKSND